MTPNKLEINLYPTGDKYEWKLLTEIPYTNSPPIRIIRCIGSEYTLEEAFRAALRVQKSITDFSIKKKVEIDEI